MFPASGLQGALFGQLQIETSKVPAGSYVLVVTATDTATGRSASATATLRIVYGTYSETVVHSTAHINWIARSDIYGSYQSGFQAFFDFADSAYTQIEQFLAISSPVVPLKIRVTDSWGYGASASYGELELSYAMLISSAATAPSWIQSFPRPANEWAYGVIVHEMVNVFSGSVTRDWPTDWWADTRSPFPAMVAVKVLEALGQQNFAIRQDAALGPDPLYQMFKHFQETYGWTMFQRAFSMMRSDEIDLSQIGQNPSVLKAHYVAFYLSEGAGTDLCVCVLCSFFSVFFLMPCACV
jgi:hypothetical protein